MKAWTSEKDGSCRGGLRGSGASDGGGSVNNKDNDEGSNDLDEALNELGVLSSSSSLTQTRREKWLKRRNYRYKSGDAHWCSFSSSSTSSCSTNSSGSIGGSFGSRKNSYSTASSSSSPSPFSSLSYSQSRSSLHSPYSSTEASNPPSSGYQSNCSSSSNICASLDLVGDSSIFSNHKSIDYPKVARRHHLHNQYYKPYIRPRRFSLQLGIHREETPDLSWNLLKGLSLSDSESSGTRSGTGTPPTPFFASQSLSIDPKLCSRITSNCADKENTLETRSNPNSPLRNRNIGHPHTYCHTLPLKTNQHHWEGMVDTTVNPSIASGSGLQISSSLMPSELESCMPSACCGGIGIGPLRPEDKYIDQGFLFRSKSLDDLNSLFQENHLPSYSPDEGIFNQPMFSSASCDIENVLQKISRLEM